MSARTAHLSVRTTAAVFFAGIAVGTALVGPVVPSAVAALPSPTSFGPIGTALVLSVLSLVVFVFGFVTLYFGLLIVEDR